MAEPLDEIRVEEQDLSSDDLTLEADTGQSLEIVSRGINGGSDEDVVNEVIDETMMLAYQADEGNDEIFPRDAVHDTKADVLDDLAQMGFPLPTLKVPEGKEFVLSNPDANGDAVVLYREASAGTYSDRSDGGPNGSRRPFVTNAQVTDSIASQATEDHPIDVSVNPAQLDDWPWEEDVRADREYDLIALMINLDGSAGGNITLDNFRLTSEEKDFLARSSQFVDTAMAPYPNVENNVLPFVFPEPVTFSPGDDLEIRYQASNSNTMSAEDAIVNAAAIALRRNVGGA